MGSSLGYLIREGFKNFFKNKRSTSISIITMICAMFLFGIFFTIGENINSILLQVQQKQGMEVFIFDFATQDQIDEMQEDIRKLDGVNQVTFKTKEQALESFKEQMKDFERALDGIEGENNVLPASFVVTLDKLELNDTIQAEIEQIGKDMMANEQIDDAVKAELEKNNPNSVGTPEPTLVKNIRTSNRTIETLIKIVNGVRLIIFAILLIIAVTIISNTIKLTVHSRRKEISIMKYVGATNGFIRWPFIVEGLLIGLVAAVITLLIIGGLYDLTISKILESSVLQTLGITLLKFTELAISMKKYLEV